MPVIDSNNPYVPKHHRAALRIAALSASRQRTVPSPDSLTGVYNLAYRAAGGRGLSSNYPTELRALVQSENDSLLRQDVLYRDGVRQHLVAGRLADSRHGRPDWEKGYLKRAQKVQREERTEERRLIREARQQRN